MKPSETQCKNSFPNKKITEFSPAAHIFFRLLAFNMAPVTAGQGPCPPHFLARKTILIENFQLFFHKFVSNLLKMGPKIALSNPQNSKIFSVTTMVGNVNLLRYFASTLQPSSRGPCLNINKYLFSKTTQFFSHDAK